MKQLCFSIVGFVFLWTSASAAVILNSFNSPYTQDFNTLARSGTSSVVPNGWAFVESGTNPDTEYSTGPVSTFGDTYSFGSANALDRALGSVYGPWVSSIIGASFRNDTGKTITSLAISYVGEQWYLYRAGKVDRTYVQYSLAATSLSQVGVWTSVPALDFYSPNTNGPVGDLDGNAPGNRRLVSSQVSGLNFQPGQTMWLRWVDQYVSSDGLAIDDFSITAVPEPVNIALGFFGGVAVVTGIVSRMLRAQRS